MELYVKVTLMPLWKIPANGTREARKRGDLRVEFLKLAELYEQKIRGEVEEKLNV